METFRRVLNMSKTIQFWFIIFLIYLATLVVYKSGQMSNILESEKYLIRTKPKTILLWTQFFSSRNWHLPNNASTVTETYFKNLSCPVTNCLITTDSNYLESISDFDAILFHTAEQFKPLDSVPENRTQEQFYVFAILESPVNTFHYLSLEKYFYNLTMSYRLDSDINWSYAYIEDIETGEIIAPAMNPKWRRPIRNFELDSQVQNMMNTKNTTAAWFVSHCKAQSERESLVLELQKYLRVDIYGKCSNLSCPRFSKECDDMLDNQYKFYLSFENSLCVDYVTEKLFNAMNRNIIPIVYGGAHYYRFAPPHSFIDVGDFKTVKQLADYLLFLEENPEEYQQYFWWKNFYRVKKEFSHFCRLCEQLNNPSVREKHFSYGDIKKWWTDHSCFNPKKDFL